jgi:hypothetical protein
LVGIPNLNDGDRYHGYLASALSFVEAALKGVKHDVFVSPPTRVPPWAGFVDRENVIVEKFLRGDYTYLWHVELDVQVPEDAFVKLLSLDVDIACGYVRRHNGDGLILGFLDEKMHGKIPSKGN